MKMKAKRPIWLFMPLTGHENAIGTLLKARPKFSGKKSRNHFHRRKFTLNFVLMLTLVAAMLLFVGCGNDNAANDPGTTNPGTNTPAPATPPAPATNEPAKQEPPAPQISTDPVKLSVYYMYTDSSYDSWMSGYGEYIQKKYPNFSFEWTNAKEIPFNALAASNTNVDIFQSNANSAAQLSETGFVSDMSDFIKKHNFDLNRVESVALDIIKNVSNGELTALPIYLNHHLLFYNRDIFEKFAVDFPRNHMTWDEVYDLARSLTREDGGVNYLGFSHQFLNNNFSLLNPYGQELVDPTTKEVTYDNALWASMFENFKRFYEIPGSEYLTGNQNVDAFVKDQRLAMLITLSNRSSGNLANVPENWDVVSFPEFSDRRGIGSGVEPFYLYLSSISKQKDEAFAAITAMLEDEVQVARALNGTYPSVKIPDIEKTMSEQSPALQGRNVSALFANQFAPALTLTQDTLAIRPPLATAINEIMKGEKDINTALREAKEKAVQIIEEREAAQK